MTTSPESAALADAYRTLAARFAANPDMSLEQLREMFDPLGHQQAEPRGVTYEETPAGSRPAIWATPEGAVEGRVILYTHGGGYIAHSMATSRKLVGHLAAAAGARALIPDYRLAPENPFPAALHDAIAAYEFLLDSGHAPERIAFAGESAGGNLAAAMIVRARDVGLPLPGAYVGFSPWFDLLGEKPSFDNGKDLFLLRPVSQMMAGMYLGDGDAHQPQANPLHADLHGFPPSYVTAGADESLVDAVTDFSAKARDAGVDTTLEIAEGMQHAFQWMAGRAPEADASIDRAGKWIAKHLR
jgi:monoterpene epsilon-lactone hydrolase